MSNFGQFARQSWNQTYTPPPVGPVPTAMDYENVQSVAPPKTGGGLAGMARGG
jgi:hypothetical protein